MQPEVSRPPQLAENDKVDAWRLRCFLEAGAPIALAERLTRAQGVDPHDYARLVGNGATPQLAAEILL